MPYDERIVARFWAKVRICVHGGQCAQCCWEWQGMRHSQGYGRFMLRDGPPIRTRAHRFIWAHLHGPIPPGLYICHLCDNPPCCNTSHLFLGTNSDNQLDAIRKGRRPASPCALTSTAGSRSAVAPTLR